MIINIVKDNGGYRINVEDNNKILQSAWAENTNKAFYKASLMQCNYRDDNGQEANVNWGEIIH